MAAGSTGRDGLTPLYKVATRTHAPADSETFKTLAGRSRWLYEMATGANADGDEDQQPITPLNPMGRLGHDHSGPPYGSAIQHPLFTLGGSQLATQFTIDDGTNGALSEYARTMLVSDTVNPSIVATPYVRPFPVGDDTPYGRAYLTIGAVRTGADRTLTVKLWTGNNYDSAQTGSITVSDTAWPPQPLLIEDAYWPLVPGRNKLYARFSADAASVAIYGLAANQIVKRSHSPGVPIVDLNAAELAAGNVTSWPNRGKLGGSAAPGTAPQAFTTGGPDNGAYVRFDSSNSEYLELDLSTTRATGVHFGAIVKSFTTQNQYYWDGNDATNRNALFQQTSGNDWAIFAGSTVSGGAPDTSWHRIVGRYGSDGLLRIDGVDVLGGDTGSNVLDFLTIGRRYASAFQYGDIGIARLMFWEDESDVDVIDRFLIREYGTSL